VERDGRFGAIGGLGAVVVDDTEAAVVDGVLEDTVDDPDIEFGVIHD
jgi:hypothetical protein